MTERPRKLFIEPETACKDLPLVNGKRIYTLAMKPKEWSLDGQGNIKITRYGFSIVPDFGGTAHFYCGTSLDTCIGDLLPWWHVPRMDDQLRGYIIKSRVNDSEKMLTTQPYSPQLFRCGVLPGPHLLHETLMRRMTPESAEETWRARDDESEAGVKATEDTGMVHPLLKIMGCCRLCSERKDAEVWKLLSSFVCFTDHTTAASAWKVTLACGLDLLCFPCRRERSDYAGKTPFCEFFQKHREYFKFHPDMLKASEHSPNACENAPDTPEA